MEIQIIELVVMTLYKICSLITGVILSFMGYRLFMASVWGHAGDAEGSFGDNKVIIRKAAPGTFSVVMGAIVIGLTIIKGVDIKRTAHYPETEKPVIPKPALPN